MLTQSATDASAHSAASARVETRHENGALRLLLSGDWLHHTVGEVDSRMIEVAEATTEPRVVIDAEGVDHLDTAGAWLIQRLRARLEDRGIALSLQGADRTECALLAAIPGRLKTSQLKGAERQDSRFGRLFEPIGRGVFEIYNDAVAALYILGSAVRGSQLKVERAHGISPAAIVNQIDHAGVRAVPIIVLMSFLIGAIIAQQSAFQLRYFGAEVFVVDLVGILQLREVGVLLTAIMLAGRSGSAITAEIGSMKMREEVDALKVMGLNPIGVLVFPRLVALTIVLPLLTIVANFSALFGAALVAWSYSGITPDVFVRRLQEAIDMSTVISGMIKAPFMALIIGIVAAVEGLKVGGSAESLGRRVTASVVKAIFVVILVDGLFAMFYAAIDY